MRADDTHFEVEEKEANLFAMALLMPEDLVRQEVSKMNTPLDLCDDKSIKRLADKFKVSKALMAVRLGQLYNL